MAHADAVLGALDRWRSCSGLVTQMRSAWRKRGEDGAGDDGDGDDSGDSEDRFHRSCLLSPLLADGFLPDVGVEKIAELPGEFRGLPTTSPGTDFETKSRSS